MYQILYLTGKNENTMGYIARNLTTNETFYSKGANKIADLIGCTGSNITKFFNKEENKNKDKPFKGWIITKVIEIKAKNRGSNIKFLI